MDFCLKGSQINLVTRQKAKPKYSSQTSLNLTHIHLRPRSATLQQRRQRCSPLFCRPQSADPRFGRNLGSACGQYCSELLFAGTKLGKNSKRLQSVSSSDLLKLLLDEPIKRSWLCRGAGNSSPEDQSSLGSARKSASNTSLNKRTRFESADKSSVEGGGFCEKSSASRQAGNNRLEKMSSITTMAKEKPTYSVAGKNFNRDYWPTPNDARSCNNVKPDLPGRVSFSKPNMHADLDSSDCDNDKQESHYASYNREIKSSAGRESISAPGPAQTTLPKLQSYNNNKEEANDNNGANNFKKSVRFGSKDSDGEGVLAETYEYPKCPSENCSCSTRSSSTGSLQDGLETKCTCDSPTCRFIMEAQQQQSNSQTETTTKPKSEAVAAPTEAIQLKTFALEESNVIRAYRDVVGEQLENSIVKNLLEENIEKPVTTSYMSLNNVELPTFVDKYNNGKPEDFHQEKQNNLSEPKPSSSKNSPELYKVKTSKSNLVSVTLQSDNNLNQSANAKSNYNSSSESVINNYLKVTAASPFGIKKQDNTQLTSNANASLTAANNLKKPLKPHSTAATTTKPKSSSASSLNHNGKLKKAISFGSLREDAKLDEFNLDKIDSWMSMQEQKLNTTTGNNTLAKHVSLDNDLAKFSQSCLDTKFSDGLDADDDLADTNSQISSKSDENSQDDSTYDAIVSVIKEIDEDKRQDNFARPSVQEMDLKLSASLTPSARSVADNNETENSPDKYKDILSYLDDVEESCDKALLETRRSLPDSNRSEVEFVVEPDIVEDVPKLSDLLMLPNHQLARRVIALSLRANELANAIQLSKEHVHKIRSEKQKSVRAEKANGTNRLREQKKHFESIVKRHQGFIEQLLKDKGSLCEKVAALTRRLESQNQAWEHKLDAELARLKETTLAGEKIRRERWVRENTKKIKELTVKGLETEINKMNSNHQSEITNLKREHQQQLLDALEEARLKHEQIENSIRESCAQDRESIIEKERTAIRERFERQLEEERNAREELKHQLCEDFAAERARLQAELKTKDMENQTKRTEIQRECENELEQVKNDLLEKMAKQEEKYQNRINVIEKQYENDFEIWKREYENSCKMAQVEKENSIRQHYRAERDRQIDVIVTRMDAEAQKNAEEFETKLSRLKEKYEKDLHDTESVEKSLREKYAETRNKLAESDAQVRNQQAEMKQLQIELEHSKKMCAEYVNERDQYRENLHNQMQNEVTTLKNERDKDIQKIHKRVQQAIEKKDTTIDILQKENGGLRERCLKLEAVIRQQRKDYCVK